MSNQQIIYENHRTQVEARQSGERITIFTGANFVTLNRSELQAIYHKTLGGAAAETQQDRWRRTTLG